MKHSIICISGTNGGTGKSTITKELAIGFSKKGIRTCLIDLSHGTQNAFFRILPRLGIAEWLENYHASALKLTLDALTEQYSWDRIQQYLTYSRNHDVYLLTAPSDDRCYSITQVELSTILSLLYDYFDVILIDTDSQLDASIMPAFPYADRVLLTATADATCINNLKKLRRIIRNQEWDLNRFSLILNRQPEDKNAFYMPGDLESILYFPVIAVLPEDEQVWMYNNASLPIITGPDTPLKESFNKLIEKLS